ncbi:MAG: hypothetical protein ABS91_01720 [Thiobacillus sp. SCN 64-35]|nr:MAG: hypothetical protein ABS91_01720 [Thiobacillus sp. SCN 64-35]
MSSLAGKLTSGIARLAHLGKRDDDPLTSLKAATRWVGALPVGDAYKCQQTILEELKRFNENSSEVTKDRLAVLMLLDEKSHDLQDTLVRQYLRNPRMSRQVESQLWHAVYSLYWEIARGYHTFVLDFARGAGKNAHESQIPLVTLRAVRIFGQLLKWRAVRYLAPGEKLWLRLHNLYRVAENEGFHKQRMTAYPNDSTPCSVESTYLHVLMLNLANSGTLYPRQLDLLDRWLCNWHNLLYLEPQFNSARHTFAVDLSTDHGPRRVRKPDSEKPIRYWATETLLQKLQDLQAALRDGSTPAELGLTDDARTGESVELLDHLHHHWSALSSREQRRAPRATVKRLVDVTHGLNAIINQLKLSTAAPDPAASPYSLGISHSEADDVRVYGFVTERTRERVSQMKMPVSPSSPDVERWVMQDESNCGYGVIVESRDKDWLRVGTLLGVKPHDGNEWRLGIVRRLSRLNDDTSSVGIETLPEMPTLAILYDTASSSGYTVNGLDNSGGARPNASLWLDGTADSLILDPVLYMPGRVFQVQGPQPSRYISLGQPIERSEGWIRVGIQPVAT